MDNFNFTKGQKVQVINSKQYDGVYTFVEEFIDPYGAKFRKVQGDDKMIHTFQASAIVPFYDEEKDKSLKYQRKKCYKCKYYDGYDLCTHRLNFGAIEDDSVLKCKLLFLFSKDKDVKKD